MFTGCFCAGFLKKREFVKKTKKNVFFFEKTLELFSESASI